MVPAPIIFFAAIVTNNILLSDFLGMCSFTALSRHMRTSLGMGVAVTFVMSATTVLNYLLYHMVLKPLNIEFLSLIVFILVIAGFVQLIEMVIERFVPLLYYNFGIFLPLITVNCAILGASLFMILREYGFWQTFAYGTGSGIGWTLVICAMAGIRIRLAKADIPPALQGLGITMIITALMAMAFMGFTGMVTIQ